ncbi:hypothetical protein [Parasphingorhabdus sp.]|uniref:hypothetical protein n=1 Tax=Parasphingorhabdus sp. TaxID=2709688 RepID=UPI003001C0DC
MSDEQVIAESEFAATVNAGGLPHSVYDIFSLQSLGGGSFTSVTLPSMIEQANDVPANSRLIYINIDTTYNTGTQMPAINLQDGNTLVIRGTNESATQSVERDVLGYDFLRGLFVQSGDVDLHDLNLRDFISFGGDGGNPGGDGGAMIQIEENSRQILFPLVNSNSQQSG